MKTVVKDLKLEIYGLLKMETKILVWVLVGKVAMAAGNVRMRTEKDHLCHQLTIFLLPWLILQITLTEWSNMITQRTYQTKMFILHMYTITGLLIEMRTDLEVVLAHIQGTE